MKLRAIASIGYTTGVSGFAQLYLQGVEIYAWPDEVDLTFLFLFTKDEVFYFVGEAEDTDEDGEYRPREIYQLRATAAVLRDRLEVLGIGRRVLEKAFYALLKDQYDSLSENRDILTSLVDEDLLPSIDQDFQSGLNLLENITLDDWANFLIEALKSPVKQASGIGIDTGSYESLLGLWGEYADPRLLLGAALLACEPNYEVVFDVTFLVSIGMLEQKIDPQLIAAQHVGYSLADGTPPVIITEGSTDAQFLQAAIRIRYPHLESYIRFLDFADGAEGSAAAGVRTLKSFAAAGIANRIVLLLDNDTAAREAVRAFRGSKLPDHYSVLHYPDIELARSYPTLGPTGLSAMDVNGLAGSIEMYLGRDVLTDVDGNLSPVQWRSYAVGVAAYQGEILDKTGVQKRFRAKVKQATADPSIIANQDWSGLDAIIGSLIEILRG